jgi:hypothetical protein
MATNSLIEGELFHKITRDERQEECRRKWIKNRCIGTIVASTGFGTVKVDYISVNYNAVPIEESSELLSSKIGKSPIEGNTEVIEEIKESSTPYSIENETNK